MDVCCWQISGQSRGGQKCIFVKTRDCDFCFFYLNEALPPPSHINKFNLKKHCEIVSRSLTTLSGAQFDKCNNTCLHKIDIATLDSWALRQFSKIVHWKGEFHTRSFYKIQTVTAESMSWILGNIQAMKQGTSSLQELYPKCNKSCSTVMYRTPVLQLVYVPSFQQHLNIMLTSDFLEMNTGKENSIQIHVDTCNITCPALHLSQEHSLTNVTIHVRTKLTLRLWILEHWNMAIF